MASANIACRDMESASAKQPVSGFSMMRCLPALAASMASVWCRLVTTGSVTSWMSFRSSIAR